jgi:hypothetical protein
MATVGFLSLIDRDEVDKFEEQLEKKRLEDTLPEYLKDVPRAPLVLELVFAPRFAPKSGMLQQQQHQQQQQQQHQQHHHHHQVQPGSLSSTRFAEQWQR